jgi:excisionase family DNA binding protein
VLFYGLVENRINMASLSILYKEELMTEKLLSPREICAVTGWSIFTVYRKASRGEIPGRIKIGKGSLRFKGSEVEEWLLGTSRGRDVADCGTEIGS